jgi:hypothetical protein
VVVEKEAGYGEQRQANNYEGEALRQESEMTPADDWEA